MAKGSGLGDNFYIDQYDVSGDTQSIGNIHGGPAAWDTTGIDKSAFERIGLKREAGMSFVTFFNDATTAGAEGAVTILKGLPTADRQFSYFRGTTLGNAAASLLAKQVNYDGTRDQSGALTFATHAEATAGTGLEWGNMLTAGKRTDSSATNGSSYDGAAATSFGWAAYLHVFSVVGTSVTVTLQDSADNSSFAAFTSSAFSAVLGGATGSQRIAGTVTSTVRRYVRAITTGTFSSAVFAVNFVRFPTAQT